MHTAKQVPSVITLRLNVLVEASKSVTNNQTGRRWFLPVTMFHLRNH